MPEEQCAAPGCRKPARAPYDTCYRCRVLSVGISLKAPATQGNWHRTPREWREENFGTNDERELAKRGIVRSSDYGH